MVARLVELDHRTIHSLLAAGACTPDQPAILGLEGRAPLSHGCLLQQIESTVERLNRLGIGRGDRIALVLPDGPEMAVCSLAVTFTATVAPLNPSYTAAEFEFYLSDLKPKALILGAGMPRTAADVAVRMGLPVWTLAPQAGEPGGVFEIQGAAGGRSARAGLAEPEDIALVLHTSGSTSRPKIVPCTQAGFCGASKGTIASLGLTPQDRCLNIMPMFHVHGLGSALLSTLATGGSVVCTPGFQASCFFDWLEQFRPTWYTGVPTIHQAILARAEQRGGSISRGALRFVRSASSALAPKLMARLERVFGVPVVEAYGMTEAGHQIAGNPVPPGVRKPGSVGTAVPGCEIAIMNQQGVLLASGETGEVVIRGAHVIAGYENNPEANARSFVNGWFRSGDLGKLDEDGYLFLTGRAKEIINRGGEKIAPREVDEVLLAHPAVAACATFALPDSRVGEEVAAAVVLREGASATQDELCEFAAGKLAVFKVPRRVVFLKELPKGPTGKPQRIGLADRLGLIARSAAARLPEDSPRTVHALLAAAPSAPDRPAIQGLDGRESLSYGRLLRLVDHTVEAVNRLGAGRGDRVALVLPNGPEMALCCLAVSCAATAAPLNPDYTAAEFDFYLSDLRPRALIVSDGVPPTARDAAARMGMPVWTLVPQPGEPSGVFEIQGAAAGLAARPGLAEPEDVAMVTHTSGSTSRPKMVPYTQWNLCAGAAANVRCLALTPQDRCLSMLPLFHLHGMVAGVLPSWAAGASIVCTPGFQAPRFLEWLSRFRPTWYSAVPAMHQAILARAQEHPEAAVGTGLRFIRSSSAPLAEKVKEQTERLFGVPVLEAYGMTEATPIATNPLPPAARKNGSVGRAVAGEIAIMNDQGGLLAAGETGEVAIRGPNVISGYGHDPEANARSFVNGWFRTGDLGKLDEDGYLFLTGRAKEIINRGGEKIAPREVDEVLLAHPAVAACVTFALPDSRVGEEVAAAVVLREGASATQDELCEFAAGKLAAFKVPRRIVFLDELPQGPTGKPQRTGLAERLGLAPEEVARQLRALAGPETAVERKLGAIWSEVLRRDSIGRYDDFFQLGGDSILATQVIARVRVEFGVELPMFRLFASPVFADLARWIETAPPDLSPASRPILKVPRTGRLPLSYSQQRLWFLSQFEETSEAYVVPLALRLRGNLDLSALRESLRRIAARHEVLRTTYEIEDGVPYQRISPEARVELPVEDFPAADEPGRLRICQRLAREEVRRPFDLAHDCSWRYRLVRFAPRDHLLIVTTHHIGSDGWSKSVLFRELEAFYGEAMGDAPAALPPLDVQYADFAQWQRACMDGVEQRQLPYWKQRLAGAPGLLELPADRPRPARQTFQGGLKRLLLPGSLMETLAALSQADSATLYMTLLAAWLAVLFRYSGQTDICVGTPVANRVRKETEDLIGAFVNTLVIRTDLAGDPSFRTLLQRVRESALGAYDHQDLPLEKLIEQIDPQRSLSYSPVFQTMFQLRNVPEMAPRLAGLDISLVEFDPGTAQFDLSLMINNAGGDLDCVLTYNSALFDAGTAQRMLGHYRTLLEAVISSPERRISELPLLTPPERRHLLVELNRTRVELPRQTALELFEEQARRRPEASAVSDGRARWSYAKLNREAGAIAGRLKESGIGPGTLVAVSLGRSVEMLAALIAIWRAGAAYLPLDPSYPKERLEFMIRDSGAAAVLTEGLRVRKAGTGAGARPAAAPDLAYVLYTSGSSGQPKGVAIRHSSLTNLLCAARRELGVTASDVMLGITTIAFDIAAVELFLPLITGARVFLVRRDAADPHRLAGIIASSRATIVQATPSHWRALLETGWTGNPGLKIISTGEALPKSLAARLSACGSRLWNAYGPTESTVWSTIAELHGAESTVPIGRPLANTRVYVLDSRRQPVPAGIPGELYIGGDGVADGYLGRPDLTAKRFVENPLPDAPPGRVYRTGDLVRWLPDGNLEFLRRIDNQVKIRGFRIELEEIESVLRECPGVRNAAAKVFDAGEGGPRLAVFYTSGAAKTPAETDLRRFLRRRLPDYMVPSVFAVLPQLPLTSNGKVNREALKLPGHTGLRNAPDMCTPASSTEGLLLQIWEDVLGRRPIGPEENFFELGGHSLLGVRLLARVEAAFGKRLTLANFFEAPTVAQMAAHLRNGTQVAASRVIPVRSGGESVPLYILHPSPIFRPLILALPDQLQARLLSVFDPAGMPQLCRLEDIAARQAEAIHRYQPEGPLAMAGWCADGVLALEMARQLRRRGRSMPLLVLIDSFNPARLKTVQAKRARRAGRLRFHLANLSALSAAQAVDYAAERWRQVGNTARRRLWKWMYEQRVHTPGDQPTEQLLHYCVQRYEPRPYDGPAILFRAGTRPAGALADPAEAWKPLLPGLEIVDVPGNHEQILSEPNVRVMTEQLAARLAFQGRR